MPTRIRETRANYYSFPDGASGGVSVTLRRGRGEEAEFLARVGLDLNRVAVQLREATDADELAITTITHDHAGRLHSYELLAKAWGT
jgi:hypothetical protein